MIITIARECGCYGDLIGEKLGEKLGIPVYDKKSVTQMAKEAGIYSKYPRKSFRTRCYEIINTRSTSNKNC